MKEIVLVVPREAAGARLDRFLAGALAASEHAPSRSELQRWIEAGEYDRILRGEYPRRGPEAEQRPLDKDIDEAREHYMKEAKAVVHDVVDTAKRAAQAFSDAMKKK